MAVSEGSDGHWIMDGGDGAEQRGGDRDVRVLSVRRRFAKSPRFDAFYPLVAMTKRGLDKRLGDFDVISRRREKGT
jgi:hypothetical protein